MTENLAKKKSITKTFYGIMGKNLTDNQLKNLKIEMGHKHGFLKHADRDTSEIIDINEKQVAAILYFASENYTHLFREQTSQMALIKAFIYANTGRQIGVEEDYMRQIAHFEAIAKREGIIKLKNVIGEKLREYKRLNKGSNKSIYKIEAGLPENQDNA